MIRQLPVSLFHPSPVPPLPAPTSPLALPARPAPVVHLSLATAADRECAALLYKHCAAREDNASVYYLCTG
jgi:hypothetical protein